MFLPTRPCNGPDVIGQDHDNRRKGARPNQGREPPLVWSVEFMKKVVHVGIKPGGVSLPELEAQPCAARSGFSVFQ